MANIGATTAFYKVETSLTRANNEVSKSMERLATGKQNATAGDRSSYQAMADTFRLDYVGTKAGIKGASVVMGYLETAMRTLDSASGVLSRLQELAVLGANETNTTEDADAIDFEAEKLGDEFHRLLSTAKYKGKDLFLSAAGGEYVSLGGRDAEMTFGVKKVTYSGLYKFDADTATQTAIVAGREYKIEAGASDAAEDADFVAFGAGSSPAVNDTFIATKSGTIGAATGASANKVTIVKGHLVEPPSAGAASAVTNTLTALIETVQANLNTARVQAGSQYAALESAVGYVTDLTAQYELGYNTVNDVNFSMETAHLAKNQILQQAATAMLAQANQGQQSLLQLIQG
jgi:flagellin